MPLKILINTLIYGVLLQNTCIAFSDLDYCQQALCQKDALHLACQTRAQFHDDCQKGIQMLPLDKHFRSTILHKHNKFRNQIAKGVPRFRSAIKMAKMRWSHELAFLAELNVMQCTMQRSECLNTATYPYVGQNLAYNKFKGAQDELRIMGSQIQMWFNEHKKADKDAIRTRKQTATDGKEVRNFLQLARDRANRVGCAIAKYEEDGWNIQRMTCVYNMGIDDCYPIYESGRVASKCKAGRDSFYNLLCNSKELYDYESCVKVPVTTTRKPTQPIYADLSTDEPEYSDLSAIGKYEQRNILKSKRRYSRKHRKNRRRIRN